MIRLPYTLQEGTTAYAKKVMANLNSILTVLNNLTAQGVGTNDIQTIITGIVNLIGDKITSGAVGNADEIYFDDGVNLQTKLTSGDLNGTDGVTAYSDGWAAFEVDANGHLIVSVSGESNPYSLVYGHLYFTIPEPGGGNVVQYDLGSVRGATGEVTNVAMETYVTNALAAVTGSTVKAANAYSASWSLNQCIVSCPGITASSNFLVEPAASATDVEWDLWQAANPIVVSQTTDSFTLKARGIVPTADIPLKVLIVK